MGGFPFVIRWVNYTVTVTDAVTVTKTCVSNQSARLLHTFHRARRYESRTTSTNPVAPLGRAPLRVRSPLCRHYHSHTCHLTIWRALACMHARDACELARAIGMMPLSAQHRPSSTRRRPGRRCVVGVWQAREARELEAERYPAVRVLGRRQADRRGHGRGSEAVRRKTPRLAGELPGRGLK